MAISRHDPQRFLRYGGTWPSARPRIVWRGVSAQPGFVRRGYRNAELSWLSFVTGNQADTAGDRREYWLHHGQGNLFRIRLRASVDRTQYRQQTDPGVYIRIHNSRQGSAFLGFADSDPQRDKEPRQSWSGLATVYCMREQDRSMTVAAQNGHDHGTYLERPDPRRVIEGGQGH